MQRQEINTFIHFTMAFASLGYAFLVLSTLPVALTDCPVGCPRQPYTFQCCVQGKIMCCQGSEGKSECTIYSEQLKSVKRLYVGDCIIKNLSRTTFVNISHLPIKSVELYGVKVETVAENAFEDLVHLNDICFRRIFDISITRLGKALGSVHGTPNISITLDSMDITDDTISAAFNYINTSNIQHLRLSNNPLTTLYLNKFQNWTFLKTVSLIYNKIQRLVLPDRPIVHINELYLRGNRLSARETWSTLNNTLPNLYRLDLSDNNIGDLQDLSLSNIPSLNWLKLANNHITFFNLTELQCLQSLKFLDLSSNWLNNKTYNSPIPSLEILNLSKNQFSTFPPWFCSKEKKPMFPNLTTLDLSYNFIRVTVTDAWACLNNVKTFNISGNVLISLQNNTFSGIQHLEELQIADTKGSIVYIGPLAFNNSNLKVLNFSMNGIVFVNKVNILDIFSYTPKLTQLDISFNTLSGLNETEIKRLLSPLKYIQKLIMERVGLYRLPSGLLGKFRFLHTLLLGSNQLEGHHLLKSFDSAVNISMLSLSKNFIHVIHENSFSGSIVSTLKEIDLTFNPFDCICENRWLRDMIRQRKLGTSGIILTDWPLKYTCRSPSDWTGRSFADYNPTTKECEPLNPMIIAYVTMASFLFVFVVTFAICVKFRWHIKYWKYKMTRKSRFGIDDEQKPLLNKDQTTPIYDAYTIYDHKDTSLESLLPNVLNPFFDSLGYKLFIWDHHAGFGDKITEICDGIYNSKYAVAIVTNRFLKDPWSKFQVEVAIDRQVGLQRDFLMFVVCEDVDLKLLSKYWCVHLTKYPTVHWCPEPNHIIRKAMEAQIQTFLGDPGPKNRHAQREYGFQSSTDDE